MSIYNRFFGQKTAAASDDFAIPSHLTVPEFGKVDVRKTGSELLVQFTILMEPQDEGWQTGVALDGSASMKAWYGRMVEGTVPPNVIKEYEKKGWATRRTEDGRPVISYQKEASDDAIQRGFLTATPNIVETCARDFISYLAGNLDADGGTTLIYWACGDGSAIDIVGDFTETQCRTLDIRGPNKSPGFGFGTKLTPAVKYFVDRFKDAQKGIYVFITDGKLDDLDEVKKYTTQLAKEIAGSQRNFVKCVLIGVGNEINESQMEELDNLDTGTDVDIWDHKIAKDMRALVEIFAEVVDANKIVAPTAVIYDSAENVVEKFTDGLPARVSFSMPATSQWFELEVAGRRIRQTVVVP